MGREDAFELALGALRARLRDGAFAPGGRIAASTLAANLRLSATPVREALSRLAGEGLVEERRHQGFFVRMLSGVDVADLYRLALAQLLILAARDRPGAPPETPAAGDPVGAIEALFARWMTAAGSRALAQAHLAVAAQLAPVRRIEGRLFADLEAEAAGLLAAAGGGATDFAPALRRFHGRRIQAADRLAATLNLGARYRGDIV